MYIVVIHGTQGPVKRALLAICSEHSEHADMIQILQPSGNRTVFTTDLLSLHHRIVREVRDRSESEGRVISLSVIE